MPAGGNNFHSNSEDDFKIVNSISVCLHYLPTSCALYWKHFCKGLIYHPLYTPAFMPRDIAFIFPLVCLLVGYFPYDHFNGIYSKLLVEVSRSNYISVTTQQKEFMLEPLVP